MNWDSDESKLKWEQWHANNALLNDSMWWNCSIFESLKKLLNSEKLVTYNIKEILWRPNERVTVKMGKQNQFIGRIKLLVKVFITIRWCGKIETSWSDILFHNFNDAADVLVATHHMHSIKLHHRICRNLTNHECTMEWLEIPLPQWKNHRDEWQESRTERNETRTSKTQRWTS